ncbi:MAG: 2,3-bisphosphoglycerate-dependent phosphoglycerate mutase [Nocardioidaceae bacterium]|jgi:broad specificity phosphatase PhoE|nr:2,3-bisphosphoglycerate-dependent phosphoglycerate mutase [Nocardioidaceae bacterium]
MVIQVVFETHAPSVDNEQGVATGWLPGELSRRGRAAAAALGERRRDDRLAAVFTSDLRRATQTATIAFADSDIPVLVDWRLRECDYGRLNGAPADDVHADRGRYLRSPYPDGESWLQAVQRVSGLVKDLPSRWAGRRVLVIGHLATRWALETLLNGITLEQLARERFRWREGWEYRVEDD